MHQQDRVLRRITPPICVAVAALFGTSAIAASIYPTWQDGGTYTAGTIVYYKGHDYKAISNQTDTLGAGWNPLAAPSLWLDLGQDAGDTVIASGYPTWQDGGTYSSGTIVYYNGRIYKA